MVFNRYGVSALAAALAASIAGSAVARDPIYQAQISGTAVDANGKDVSFNQGVSQTNPTPVQLGRSATNWLVGADSVATHGGTAESDVQMSPLPTQIGIGFATQLTSQVQVIYNITLAGAASDPFVPVTVGAKGTAAWSQNGIAEAEFNFSGLDIQSIHAGVGAGDPGENRLADSESFVVDGVVDLTPGQTYSVVLTTFASSDVREFQSNPDGSISFGMDTAVVDPTFTVDAAFADRWSIAGVPVDTSTPAGVPEPAAWMLLIAGFGFAGATLRRRPALSAATP